MKTSSDVGISDEELQSLLSSGAALYTACAANDLSTAKNLIEQGAPLWYQDPDTDCGPLHAAALVENEAILNLLIDKGAVWNAGMTNLGLAYKASGLKPCHGLVDFLGNTAGDIALSLNNEPCYRIIRDAGIRSG